MEVGVMIKDYLERNGISQAHISRKTGISTPKLNLSLNGSRRLPLNEYAAICDALGVSTDYFLKPYLSERSDRNTGSKNVCR